MYAAGTRHVLFKDDDCYRADCSAESKRDGVVRPPFTASTASTAARSKVELVDGDGDFVAKLDGLAQDSTPLKMDCKLARTSLIVALLSST